MFEVTNKATPKWNETSFQNESSFLFLKVSGCSFCGFSKQSFLGACNNPSWGTNIFQFISKTKYNFKKDDYKMKIFDVVKKQLYI